MFRVLKHVMVANEGTVFSFSGDNVDCWMEIQHGKGPWAPPVSGIVPLGSILTLVVAINDYRGKGERTATIYRYIDMRPTVRQP